MSASQEITQAESRQRDFRAGTPAAWFVKSIQTFLRIVLPVRTHLHFRPEDLEMFRGLNKGSGMILTPNHADELDPPICMELSRIVKKQFMMMCNREAFDEYRGIAGWVFQHIGVFSVERGGHDSPSKEFATSVVKSGKDVLLIFPEGEIYYLNEMVQPFHSGAIDIGLRAIIEQRDTCPDFTAVIIPMAIKYRYPPSIRKILEKRVQKMEQKLSQDLTGYELKKRLAGILADLLQKQELAFGIESEGDRFAQLSERVKSARHAILGRIEKKYSDAYNAQSRTIDRVFQLSAKVREKMKQDQSSDGQAEYQNDLTALEEVAHMVSWQPQYIDSDPSIDRLAEMVLKLERELYGIKRPKPLAKRDVFIRLAKPVDLGPYVEQYIAEPHVVRHKVAEELRQTIQFTIDDIAASTTHPMPSDVESAR